MGGGFAGGIGVTGARERGESCTCAGEGKKMWGEQKWAGEEGKGGCYAGQLGPRVTTPLG